MEISINCEVNYTWKSKNWPNTFYLANFLYFYGKSLNTLLPVHYFQKKFVSIKFFIHSKSCTAWKVSVFGLFLIRVFPHSDWIWKDTESKCLKIRTRKTPNMDTFHAILNAKFVNHQRRIQNSVEHIRRSFLRK